MQHRDPADLDWLAFQYVSEELSAKDAAHFEDRLAVDQSAREAVAEAMLLVQAISAGSRVSEPARANRSWHEHAGWAALGAAVCLAVIVMLRSSPQQPAPMAQRPQAADLGSAELALVWAQSDPNIEVAPAETVVDEDSGLAVDTREVDREFVVPAWMLEAVSGAAETKSPANESQES